MNAEIIALIAVSVASIGLIFTAWSFYRLGKTEQLRVLEGIYREIARGLKEFRLLDAESPKIGEEEKVRQKKLNVLLSEEFADINWLCFLIRNGKIKDRTLVNAFENPILDWSYFFEQRMPNKVHDDSLFPDFKILYRKLRHERHKETK